jgi:lysophospholipase L1-like esterase
MKYKALFAARVCGWLIIALLTLEVSARTEDKLRYGAPFFGNYSIDTLYQNTPQGKFGRPNSSYLKWHLNEVGFRGPALRSGTYRIVCLGSSETFGLYESPDHEWPRQLEEMLNRSVSGQRYEVIDGAYPGMSIATNLRRLPQTLSTLDPKMVVIYPSYTPYIEINHPLDPQAEARKPVKPLPSGDHFEWRIQGRFETLMKNSLPESLQNAMRDWQIKHDTRTTQVMDRLPDQNVLAFETDLDALTTQLRAQGVQVVLVTHANRFGSNVDPAERPVMVAWRKFFPTLSEGGFLDMERRMSDAVRQIGAARGVPVVDAAALVAPGKANFAEFVHFTDAGATALASAVSSEIEHEANAGTLPDAPH